MKGLRTALPKNEGNGGLQAGCEPALCPHSPESQLHLALHQKLSDQQVKGGDPVPLFCTGEASSGALHPVVILSTGET